MLIENPIKHFIDEPVDLARNPFTRTTRIDCDKLFATESVNYSEKLIASRRCDVCQELYNKVVSELEKDGWDDVSIGDEQKLIELNPLITPIE